jgi:hypothetical protein
VVAGQGGIVRGTREHGGNDRIAVADSTPCGNLPHRRAAGSMTRSTGEGPVRSVFGVVSEAEARLGQGRGPASLCRPARAIVQ